MKKTVFTLCTLLCLTSISAQRFFDLGVRYEEDGFEGTIGYSFQGKSNDTRFTRIALNASIENYDKSQEEVPVSRYTLGIENYRSLNSFFENFTRNSFSDNVILYIGAGLLGGYELVNEGKEYLPNGKGIREESNFIYGGHIGSELTIHLFGDNHSATQLFINGRYNFYLNSDIGSIQPSVGAGIRFMIHD